MRKLISILFIIVFGYILFRAHQTQQTGVVQPLFPGMENSGTTVQNHSNESKSITDTLDAVLPLPNTQKEVQYIYVTRVVIETHEVVAQSTPYPTYTPYPTQTPYPTATPTTNIGDWGEGRKYTEVWDVWATRIIVFFIFIGIGFGIAYAFRLDYLTRQYIHEEKMETIRLDNEMKIKEKELEVESAREPDRKLIVNSRHSSNQNQMVDLVKGSVEKDLLILFCKNYRDIGFDEDDWEAVGIDMENLSIIFAELINDKLMNQYGWIDKTPTIVEVANALSISRDDVLQN